MMSSILEQMFGWKDLQINMLNNKQLASLAGGMWLKLEMQGMTNQFMKTQKTGDALEKLFWQQLEPQCEGSMTLAFRLMAHLASQTQFIINDYECDSLVLTQNLYDKTNLVFT